MNNDLFILNNFKKIIKHDEETLKNPDVFLEIEKWARLKRDTLERDIESYYVLIYDEEHHEEQRTVYQPIGLITKDEAYDILTNLSYAKTNAKITKVSERDFKNYIYIIELNEAAQKLLGLINYKDENYEALFDAYSSICKKKSEIRKKVGLNYDYEIVRKFNRDSHV